MRKTDLEGSAVSERVQNVTGKRNRDARLVLRLLVNHPNSTTRELAFIGDVDRHMVAKRMNDLAHYTVDHVEIPLAEKNGTKYCTVSRMRGIDCWRATEEGKRVLSS